jgi:hypothetical protein
MMKKKTHNMLALMLDSRFESVVILTLGLWLSVKSKGPWGRECV